MGIAEVKFIVSDKKLYTALKLLEGLALQPPVVHVPEGLVNKGSKPRPANGVTGIIRNYVKGKKTVTTTELKKEAIAHGYEDSSYSYAVQMMTKAKELKRDSLPGQYKVLI